MQNYIKQAQRTSATAYGADTLPACVNRLREPARISNLRERLESLIRYTKELDLLKRAFFYGKEDIKPIHFSSEDRDAAASITEIDAKIIHGILGKITEAGEMAEALIARLNDGSFDHVNLREELGDSQWYDAELLAAMHLDSFDPIQVNNIAKLQARFPEKFTNEKAVTRDLAAERAELEK